MPDPQPRLSSELPADSAAPAPSCCREPGDACLRTRLWIPLALFLFPLLVYGQTIFHRFGFRDDYSMTREAVEEPGKLLRVCGAQGRPLYGWLLQLSASHTPDIADFCWLRFGSALCLGLLAALLFAVLRRLQWPSCSAALTAALLALLPSAQLLAGWGICWPHALADALGLAAFALAEGGLAAAGSGRRWAGLGGAVLAIVTGALIYQAGPPFYWVGVAGALGMRIGDEGRKHLRWLGCHAAVLGIGLLLAFGATVALHRSGLFAQSPRVALEADIPGKLVWSAREVLPQILALFVIGDMAGRTAFAQGVAILLVGGLLLGGLVRVARRHGAWKAFFWLAMVALLPAAAYGVSLLAAERWVSYRTLFAASAVVLVLAMTVLRWAVAAVRGRRLCLGVLAAATFCGVLAAGRQALTLIALPQAAELGLVENGAKAVDPARNPRVFVITPVQEQSPAALRWNDEFGSLSMVSYWTPAEALKHVMRERYPSVPDINRRYRLEVGGWLPEGARPDVVIDLRKIRECRLGE